MYLRYLRAAASRHAPIEDGPRRRYASTRPRAWTAPHTGKVGKTTYVPARTSRLLNCKYHAQDSSHFFNTAVAYSLLVF